MHHFRRAALAMHSPMPSFCDGIGLAVPPCPQAPGDGEIRAWEDRMASTDALVLSPRATLEQQRDTIVLVRWALILTCAYLMLLGTTVGPMWLGPLLVAAFLGSNLVVGRFPHTYFGQQRFKISIAFMDVCFIAASLWVAQQLSGELFLLCLGV